MNSQLRFWNSFLAVFFCLTLQLHSQQVQQSTKPEQARQPEKADPSRWETSIKAFELADKTNTPPKDAVLFIGSSSIRLWKTLTNDFPEFPVINRGFGGSTIAECVRYVERIALPYRPKAIVFYAGDNDLAQHKTPQQVFEDFKRFVYKVHWAQPDVKIFFVSVKPSPARWAYKDHVIKINELVQDFSKKEKNLHFVDIYTPMIGADGLPREELFIRDKLHLNNEGYQLWTALIRPRLLATLNSEASAKD